MNGNDKLDRLRRKILGKNLTDLYRYQIMKANGAEFSDDGKHRLVLWRRWALNLPVIVWVLLNPSTANGEKNDQTLHKITEFAMAAGAGGLIVVNAYSMVTPHPRVLRATAERDRLHTAADDWIAGAMIAAWQTGGLVICGWGATVDRLDGAAARVARIVELAALVNVPLHALKVTQSGQPYHPLYLPGDLVPVPWSPRDVGRVAAKVRGVPQADGGDGRGHL